MVIGEPVMFRRGRRWRRARLISLLPDSAARIGEGIVVGTRRYEMHYTVPLKDLKAAK